MVLGSNLWLLEVIGGNGGVNRWSWIRILDFSGVNGGVVHGRGFVGLKLLLLGVIGGVVHGHGFESLPFWGSMV
jgi:hypothetical protein